MIWYEDTKKRSKDELQKDGRFFTLASMIVCCISAGLVLANTFTGGLVTSLLLFSLTVQLISFFHLLGLKKEWHERFCKWIVFKKSLIK